MADLTYTPHRLRFLARRIATSTANEGDLSEAACKLAEAADRIDPTVLPIATRYEFGDPRLYQGNPRDHAELHDEPVIVVEWRGGATWAVMRRSAVWSEMGQVWEHEPIPSSRTPEFLERTRYDLRFALEIAARLAGVA